MLADPVVVGADIGLRVARRDFVEHVERADALTGGEVFDLEVALRQLTDPRSQPLSGNAKAREVPGPGGNDGQGLATLRDRRRG
jgi:hypothetical protein